jgi:hypothetical protein
VVTALPPFLYETNAEFNLTEVENMLFQMITMTNDEFEPSQLRQSPLAIDYFNPKTYMSGRSSAGPTSNPTCSQAA